MYCNYSNIDILFLVYVMLQNRRMKFKKEQRAKSSSDKQTSGSRPKSEGSSYSGSDTENSNSCHGVGGGGGIGPDRSPGVPLDCAVTKAEVLSSDPYHHPQQQQTPSQHHQQKQYMGLHQQQQLPDPCDPSHMMSRAALGPLGMPIGPDVSPGGPRDSPGGATGNIKTGGVNNNMESPTGHHGNMSPMTVGGTGGHNISPFPQNGHGYVPTAQHQPPPPHQQHQPPPPHRSQQYQPCSSSNFLVTGSMYSDISPLDHHTAHVQTHCMTSHPGMNGPINCSMSTASGYAQGSYDYIPKLTHL